MKALSKKVYITHLYPKEMSIYGDIGNIKAFMYRLGMRGIQPVYQTVSPGDSLPAHTDFYFIGGGQDKEQEVIFRDMLTKKKQFFDDVEAGVCLLAICGGYQLLGHSFLTSNGVEIEGLGLFDVVTKAPDSSVKSRCIGNIVTSCLIDELYETELIGFENHGGQTDFVDAKSDQKTGVVTGRGCYPLGSVWSGFGNNSSGQYEGCVYKHAVGTYLHGSCLPKNPQLTDWFIRTIVGQEIQELDDTLEEHTRQSLLKRFVPSYN